MDSRIIICGHSRHGKDTLAKLLMHHYGLRYQSSSWFAKDFVWEHDDAIKSQFATPFEAWEHRNDTTDLQRLWFKAIQEMNRKDKTTLATLLFSFMQTYCGMRDLPELEACKDKWPDCVIIWVDATERLKAQCSKSNTISANDCDFTIPNNGTEREFEFKVKRVFSHLKGF